jgi:hypothetical protein
MTTITARYSSGTTRRFSSAAALSRVLQGKGKASLRSTITRKANSPTGGYVAGVWVKAVA